MSTRRPSDLECFCLGLIWSRGPLSVYTLRKHFQESPSTQWSGSAGAIYPLVERLERLGLVVGESVSQGRRQSKRYRVTDEGVEVLRAWVMPPLPPEAVTVAYDPLRARARFLGLLDPQQQRQWLDHAQESLREVGKRVEQWDEQNESEGYDVYARLMTAHGRRDVAMRAEWLREARRMLGVGGDDGR
jgi:DNA-binding PadR family transcriptional regulator